MYLPIDTLKQEDFATSIVPGCAILSGIIICKLHRKHWKKQSHLLNQAIPFRVHVPEIKRGQGIWRKGPYNNIYKGLRRIVDECQKMDPLKIK